MSTKLNFEDLILVKAMYNEKLSRAILSKNRNVIIDTMNTIIYDSEYDWYNVNYDTLNIDELKILHEIDIRDFVACYEG